MVDTNRPAYFEVIDTENRCVVAVCSSQAAAFALCDELEPDDREASGHWRYIIEPMRAAFSDDGVILLSLSPAKRRTPEPNYTTELLDPTNHPD